MKFFNLDSIAKITQSVNINEPPYGVITEEIAIAKCAVQVSSNSKESGGMVESDYKVFMEKIGSVILKRGMNIDISGSRNIYGKITQFETLDFGTDDYGVNYGTVLWVKEAI